MKRFARASNRITAVICMTLVILSQLFFVVPAISYAETAGDVLVVRVQYFGESGNKIREKASFSRAELEAMGAETHYYSNITRVGTVMTMAARGPKVMDIISRSGIDANSIQNITFRTTDGYTRNFTVAKHMTATKYYYPNLSSCYERNEDGNALTPTEGALEGRETVPSILALEFGESKAQGMHAEDLEMSTNKTYRFCMGQSKLTEGKMTDPHDDGGDISSMESCHSIYGIDVTLYGNPDEEGGTDFKSGDDKKVGSEKKSVSQKTNDGESGKKITLKTREVRLGDKIVEEVSPQEKLRNNMASDAETLSAVEPYSRAAAIATACGVGALFGLGAIGRILKFRKRF